MASADPSADPKGGTGGPDPPGKSQVIWVSIGNKQLDPPRKRAFFCQTDLDPPGENSWIRACDSSKFQSRSDKGPNGPLAYLSLIYL